MKGNLLKRIFAVLALLSGLLFFLPAAPASALTNCSDTLIKWSVTHHGIDYIDVQTRFLYKRCTGPSGNPVVDIQSADVSVYTFGSNRCDNFLDKLQKVRANLNVTDLAGHNINPAAVDIPCEADGFMIKTWGRSYWDDTVFRADAGAQWSNDYHIYVDNGDDKDGFHSGGFPLNP